MGVCGIRVLGSKFFKEL